MYFVRLSKRKGLIGPYTFILAFILKITRQFLTSSLGRQWEKLDLPKVKKGSRQGFSISLKERLNLR